jgi:transcriptional regulator with GAF, ATPase, and Fis domain
MFQWLVDRLRKSPNPADPKPLIWQKTILITAAALVCLYLLSVVRFGQQVPDIGLYWLLSPEVSGYDHQRIVESSAPGSDLTKYRVKQVGDTTIHTWPGLIKALHELPDNPEAGSQTHRISKGQEEVQVKLQKPGSEAAPIEVWCRVNRNQLESLLPSLLWFVLKGSLFLVGVLVWWKRPHDRSAAQFFFLSLVTVGAYMGGYHWWRIVPWPTLILVFMISGVLLPAVNLHFYLLFPRPKWFLQQHPAWTLGITYGVPLVFLAAMIVSYFHARSLVEAGNRAAAVNYSVDQALQQLSGVNPVIAQVAAVWHPASSVFPDVNHAVDGGLKILGNVILVYITLAALWYLASIICLGHSYWTAGDATERNQVKCILFGSLLALIPISYSLYLVLYAQDSFGKGDATWPMFAASLCITTAYAVSITRYRLMQLDQLLSSGVVYFLISFLAGLIYYAVVFVAMVVAGRGIGGPSLGNALTVSTVALVLTIILELARGRLQKALDRRFRKEKHHLDRTLQQMGKALEQLVDPPTLARRLLQTSAELLGVARGSIYLREGNPALYRLAEPLGSPPPLLELAPGCPLVDTLQKQPMLALRRDRWAVGDPDQSQLRFLGGETAQALTHEGHLLALLILGPKESGPYAPEDFNLLSALAQITALALENAERHRTIESLNRDLHAKVEKISEQQRRIMALQSQLVKESVPAASPSGAENNGSPRSTDNGQRTAESIVGSSPVVRQLLQMVRKVAQSPSAVLIRGESGTGKELLARALHENSPRAGKAFVKVHCAALSTGLLESELFGHVKGAFTSAHRDKVGRFELANSGTLFLDEIGDISLEVQTKLLRVLQEMTFERVGSSEPVQVDVRMIAATHQDLEELIRQGRFREDLFYRLNVITMPVPPLRERREDITELAMHFLRVYAQRAGRPVPQLDDDVLAALKGYSWPGNIRQLENVIERAVVVAEGPIITMQELAPELLAPEGTAATKTTQRLSKLTPLPSGSGRSRREDLVQREKEQLVRALAQADGNKADAARALGLPRSTLLSKLKKFGLS